MAKNSTDMALTCGGSLLDRSNGELAVHPEFASDASFTHPMRKSGMLAAKVLLLYVSYYGEARSHGYATVFVVAT
jgi:hypothetical protein